VSIRTALEPPKGWRNRYCMRSYLIDTKEHKSQASVCRQEGCVDVPSSFVGFAAYKYIAGVGLLPHLNDVFQPVSTAFAITARTDDGDGYCYAHVVEQCRTACPTFDTLEANENYVAVSTPATMQRQRSRDKLNLAST
jgi:hypothetical protein